MTDWWRRRVYSTIKAKVMNEVDTGREEEEEVEIGEEEEDSSRGAEGLEDDGKGNSSGDLGLGEGQRRGTERWGGGWCVTNPNLAMGCGVRKGVLWVRSRSWKRAREGKDGGLGREGWEQPESSDME